MTAEQITTDADPVRITATTNQRRDTTNDRIPLSLGDSDEVYLAVRPKAMVLLRIAQVLVDDTQDEMAQMAAFNHLLEKVLDADSHAALIARLEDEADPLDIDSPEVEEMFKFLVGLWYGRPTGSLAGRQRSSKATGKRSTVRSRSKR